MGGGVQGTGSPLSPGNATPQNAAAQSLSLGQLAGVNPLNGLAAAAAAAAAGGQSLDALSNAYSTLQQYTGKLNYFMLIEFYIFFSLLETLCGTHLMF